MKLAIRTWEDHSHSHEEHHLDQSPHPDEGVVPAYAGSTARSAASLAARAGSSPHTRGALPRRPLTARLPQDHPRIRGEHLVVGDGALLREGIIPAYAGSTVWRRDHPRIRGEHARHGRLRQRPVGIIPAYAGSTEGNRINGDREIGSSPHTRGAPGTSSRWRCRRWDHPRIRGEHRRTGRASALQSRIIPAYAGSTLIVLVHPFSYPWIIPAYAGST